MDGSQGGFAVLASALRILPADDDRHLDRHPDGVTLVLPWSSAPPAPDGSTEPAGTHSESLVAR